MKKLESIAKTLVSLVNDISDLTEETHTETFRLFKNDEGDIFEVRGWEEYCYEDEDAIDTGETITREVKIRLSAIQIIKEMQMVALDEADTMSRDELDDENDKIRDDAIKKAFHLPKEFVI